MMMIIKLPPPPPPPPVLASPGVDVVGAGVVTAGGDVGADESVGARVVGISVGAAVQTDSQPRNVPVGYPPFGPPVKHQVWTLGPPFGHGVVRVEQAIQARHVASEVASGRWRRAAFTAKDDPQLARHGSVGVGEKVG